MEEKETFKNSYFTTSYLGNRSLFNTLTLYFVQCHRAPTAFRRKTNGCQLQRIHYIDMPPGWCETLLRLFVGSKLTPERVELANSITLNSLTVDPSTPCRLFYLGETCCLTIRCTNIFFGDDGIDDYSTRTICLYRGLADFLDFVWLAFS